MPTTPHPITKEKVPLTMGHEISGIVEEIGEGVDDIKVGSRVVVQPIIYDGTCNACKEGYINCCDNNGFVGLSGKGAGNTRTVKESILIHIRRMGWWTLGAPDSSSKSRLQNSR